MINTAFISLLAAVLSFASPARAQMRNLPAIGLPTPSISLDSRYEPRNSSRVVFEDGARLAVPVFKRDDNAVAITAGFQETHFGQNILLDDGTEYTDRLSRLDFGVMFQHQRTENRNWSIRANVGYAGDQAFQDLSYSVLGSYGYPSSGRGYWVLFLLMGNNNPIANYVPIPGFAYIYRTPTFMGTFGFPFLVMQWTPPGVFSFGLSVFGPIVNAEIAVGSQTGAQVFTRFTLAREDYIPHVREDTRDRLIFRENRLVLGARSPLGLGTKIEAQAGYVDQRQLYIGQGFFQTDGGRMTLSQDWIFGLNLTTEF